jgi:hypothetical protein
MAEYVLREQRLAMPWRGLLPFLVAAGAYFLLLPLGGRLLNDPDSYSHLAVAHWIFEHRAFPNGDPFTHTMPGGHWVAFEWLSEVIYGAAFALNGWPAVVVLALAVIAATFGLLTRFLLRELPAATALLLVTASFTLTVPHLLARPHLLAFPVLVLWAGTLLRAANERRAPPFMLLPLMIVWANLHASFILGLALLGPLALQALWQAEASQRLTVVTRWTLFGLFAVAAGFATPYGSEIFLVTYRTISLGEALSIVTEWQGADFAQITAFEVCLLLGIGYALYRGLTLPPVTILVLLGLLHLALSQSRHADLLALLAPLFLARPLAQHLKERDGAEPLSPHPFGTMSWTLAAIGAVAAVGWGLFAARDVAPDRRNTPSAAVAAANLRSAGPILNDYNFGGYLDYAGIPSFIDGRAELYGGAFVMRHHRALSLQNLPDFLKLLDEYRIDTTLLAPVTPAVTLLDRLPEWQRVYADDVAVVHKRRALP